MLKLSTRLRMILESLKLDPAGIRITVCGRNTPEWSVCLVDLKVTFA